MVKDTTLYDRLSVQPNASNAEILKAYKKMALKYHPDRNPDNLEEANQRLQEINQAKEVLCDDDKRKMYDDIGMDYVSGAMPQHHGMNPEDIFGSMFGGGHPFANMRRQQQQKENVVINQEVSLEDIYNETTIPVQFQQKHLCQPCNGEGTHNGQPSKCQVCDGRGVRIQVVQMGPMIQQIQSPCGACGTTGKSSNHANKCGHCNGDGFRIKDVRVNIPLKNGLSNGQQIQIPGHGHNLKDGKTDLIIIVNEKSHPKFKRNNSNLLIEVELKLYQAIYGFEKVIEHLDKRKLHISHTGKTEHGSVKRIPNEGMVMLNSNNKTKGELFIKFNIKLPNIENNDIYTKLLYLLKSIDNEESNVETIIKNSQNNYIKTVLLNSSKDPFTNPEPEEQHQQQQQRHPFEQHHAQQCSQQ
jgi:DnaJ-class molecular chaperone